MSNHKNLIIKNGSLGILPCKSGVYIFKDGKNKIIYIGKAKNLSKRVRSYFHGNYDSFLNMKPFDFIEQIKSVDFIVTDSEEEALILEGSLIKKNNPKYNIELRDDKSYPFIAVTENEIYPRVFLTRNRNLKGVRYYGPYTEALAARKTLEHLRKIFKLRDCKKSKPGKSSKPPCLNYHIDLCSGPCMGKISKEDYKDNIRLIKLFLEGKDKSITEKLKSVMKRYSDSQEFEKAAEVKKKIEDISKLRNEQKIFLSSNDMWDFISPAKEKDFSIVSLFAYRSGNLVMVNNFTINNTFYLTEEEVLSGFIKKYYMDINNFPSILFVPRDFEEMDDLASHFSKNTGKKIKIKIPLKGGKRNIMNMVVKNSRLYLEKKKFEKNIVDNGLYEKLISIKEIFGLQNIPLRIECFDISNLKDTFPVGSMVLARNGVPDKAGYRHFKINSVKSQDDCAMIEEMLERRLKYLEGQNLKIENSFYIIPDMIIIDGGKAQFNTAYNLLCRKMLYNIDIISIAKKEEMIFSKKFPYGIKMESSQNYIGIITGLRDEAHRFAINYHRKLRDEYMTNSFLDEIRGIGEKKKGYILSSIDSIEELKNMEIKDIMNIKGLSYKDALNIFRSIHR